MFWSPAVTTFSVAGCCAAAGRANRIAAVPVRIRLRRSIIVSPLFRREYRAPLIARESLVSLRDRKKMQCRRRQRDPDRPANRELTRIVDQVAAVANADRITVKASGIGALHDPPAQHQATRLGHVGRAEPRVLA